MTKRTSIPTVSEFTWRIKDLLEGEFSGITVNGEVSQPTTSANGHIYFTLKDEGASVACVVWRSTAQRLKSVPAHGQQINVSGDVQVYPPSGRYQIVVRSIEQAGEGALQMAFERLKSRLEAEGLFDQSLKKPLPRFPHTIGVVTSETGAAFQDIRSTLERRFPLANIKLYHAAVQGVSAAGEIASGIHWFSSKSNVDVLIVGRGGGSLEDLWPFNEEVVARAIAACPIPVISAVGHETDFSISDFVADVRAATPTQAAVLATPDILDLRMGVMECERRIDQTVRGSIELFRSDIRKMLKTHALMVIGDKLRFNRDVLRRNRVQLDQLLRSQLVQLKQSVNAISRTTGPSLQIRVLNERKKITSLEHRANTIISRCISTSRSKMQLLDIRMHKVDPTEPMERGFTRILQDGKWVRRKADFDANQPVAVQWKDGDISLNRSNNPTN